MRIAFCIYDFDGGNLPLQPWLTIRLVAEGLARRGHDVHMISDAAQPARIAGVESHTVDSLRGSNSAEMRALLGVLHPDALVFLPTPLNITTSTWLDGLECRCVGFVSYPFYSTRELLTAARHIGWNATRKYLRHLLVPKPLWTRAMHRRVHVLVAQSVTTAMRLESTLGGLPASMHIPPGIELTEWPFLSRQDNAALKSVTMLYLGAAVPIRGFDITLDALAHVRDDRVRLRVLARGADSNAIAAIHTAVARRGLNGRVDVEGGWMDRSRLIEEIHAADVVLQPFVLVPSELPVTTMEVIACGTPVIGSAIDGLPSTIGQAGTVVRQASVSALSEAIRRFTSDTGLREAWRAACRAQRDQMMNWETVVERWERTLKDITR